MNNIKKLSLPTFLLWSIFFSLNAYSSDLSLNEEERESTMHYSFSFTNNFPGDKDYSSNIVLIIVEKNDEKKAFDRRVLKVNYLETLQVALPYNIIRMNVYMSSPLIENSPRKEYTSQEFLEKYGRLPSPRHSPRKDYASGKSCFVTYENIELPCSMIFDSECEL